MKRFSIICAFVLIHVPIYAEIVTEQADTIVLSYLQGHMMQDYALFRFPEKASKLRLELLIDWFLDTPSDSSFVYFIDELPYGSWAHDCQYLFVNENGMTIRHHSYPPKNIGEWNLLSTPSHTIPNHLGSRLLASSMNNISSQDNHSYAVIISGGIEPAYNHWRYWNDCSFMYKTLVNKYNYMDSHIIVLMADGTDPSYDQFVDYSYFISSPLDLDGDGDDDIQYSATKQNITHVFDSLANVITQEDQLFVFTTDHGGLTMDSTTTVMCLWNHEYITPTEFNQELNKTHANIISIVMEQCNSGGFLPELEAKNRIIVTACRSDQSSYAYGATGEDYDKFSFLWTSAMNGEDPYSEKAFADYNGDGVVSFQEAFRYASTREIDVRETPIYFSSKPHLGEYFTLNGPDAATDFHYHNVSLSRDRNIYGYNVSIDAMAQGINVTPKTLFNRYQNKENMENTVQRHWYNLFWEHFQEKQKQCNNAIEQLIILACDIKASATTEKIFFNKNTLF